MDFSSSIGGAIVVAVLWSGGYTIGEITKPSPKDPVSMQLLYLDYEDGRVRQGHKVTGVDVLDAEWVAQIRRGSKPLCSGGSSAPYMAINELEMNEDVWTGDECPDLLPGDVLVGSWAWVGDGGVTYRISGTLILTEDHLSSVKKE